MSTNARSRQEGNARPVDYTLGDLGEGADNLDAFAVVPGGSILRLVGYESEGHWIEAVEIGEPGDWTVVSEGYGLEPTQDYNQLIDQLGAQ